MFSIFHKPIPPKQPKPKPTTDTNLPAINLNINLSPQFNAALIAYCEKHNIAKSSLVRDAIAQRISYDTTSDPYVIRTRPGRYYQTDTKPLSHKDKQLTSIRRALRDKESAAILDKLITP